MKYTKIIYNYLAAWLLLFLATLPSCDYIHDDIAPCKHYLRFAYVHNMKFADAFVHEMECQATAKNLRLYIFDAEGKFLRAETIEGEALRTNRHELTLDPGTYRLLAWAGLNETDYEWTTPAAGSSVADFHMSVKRSTGQTVARELLGLFQGEMKLEIPEGGETEQVMPLVKNTNKIRFVIIDTNSGTELSADSFDMLVTTGNGDLSHDNQPVSNTMLTWLPYYKGIETVKDANGTTAYTAICTELNTLRLLDDSGSRLQVRYSEETTPFLDVDLTDFLLLTQMESHKLEAQEYLDRQDEYVVMVYVDTMGGKAHCLEVIVNDWVIRLDDLTLGKEEL
ncbi:FimB/Mfa2 family fimbrial subunit [uncultured Parabacteroides sp.]|uniref:FimB/Mfa2 family fimbrial subunit n=1 Tax=uncultured Parabacteroides sp. TaxID=512312 RepID=UPI00259BA733|nr:FimB/Mfa2 family fimbrial subunit [uncultured Parabacteroides sp.]